MQRDRVQQRLNETKTELVQYTAALATAGNTITAASQTVAGGLTNVSLAKEAVRVARVQLDQKRATVQQLSGKGQGANSEFLNAHLLQETQKRRFTAVLRKWTGAADRHMSAEDNSKANAITLKKAKYELQQAQAAEKVAVKSMSECTERYTVATKKHTASKAAAVAAVAKEKGARLKALEKQGATKELKSTVEGLAADKASVMVDGDTQWQSLVKAAQQMQKTEDEQDKKMDAELSQAYIDNVTSIVDQQKAAFDVTSSRLTIVQGERTEREAQKRRAQRIAEMTSLIADQTKMRAYGARMAAAHAAGRTCKEGSGCKQTVEMSAKDKGLFESDDAYRKALNAAIKAERAASKAAMLSKHAQQSVAAAIAKAKQEAETASANPMLQLDPSSPSSRLEHTAKQRLMLQEAADSKVEAAEAQTATDRGSSESASSAAASASAEAAHQNAAIETLTKTEAEKIEKLAAQRVVEAKAAAQLAIRLNKKSQTIADAADEKAKTLDAELAKQLAERLVANSSQTQSLFGHQKIVTAEATEQWTKDNLAFREKKLEKIAVEASQSKQMLSREQEAAVEAKQEEVKDYRLQRKAVRVEKNDRETLAKATAEYEACKQVSSTD